MKCQFGIRCLKNNDATMVVVWLASPRITGPIRAYCRDCFEQLEIEKIQRIVECCPADAVDIRYRIEQTAASLLVED